MRYLFWILLVLSAFVAFATWLGWGRRGEWSQVIGWSAMTSAPRNWAVQSAASYEALENRPELKWLGHATLEIEWAGLRLVTDPVNSERVKVAPRLFKEPVLQDDEALDAILLSHAHMDHLDNATLERLLSTRLFLPAGTECFLSEAVLRRHEIVRVELWEPIQLGALRIIPVPAAHGGWRYPWQKGLFACGYVVQQGTDSLYVAGDTAAGAPFEEIRARYAPRYAVLPIGAYSPEWFLRCRHLNPEEALAAATELGAEYLIPYHFGTFRLSLEPVDQPLRRFAAAARQRAQKWFLPL
jgi:L-ascorbate metabolism protein UlaG (beta-lactamase superfamily)